MIFLTSITIIIVISITISLFQNINLCFPRNGRCIDVDECSTGMAACFMGEKFESTFHWFALFHRVFMCQHHWLLQVSNTHEGLKRKGRKKVCLPPRLRGGRRSVPRHRRVSGSDGLRNRLGMPGRKFLQNCDDIAMMDSQAWWIALIDDQMWKSQNSPGSYRCVCKQGFRNSGHSCIGLTAILYFGAKIICLVSYQSFPICFVFDLIFYRCERMYWDSQHVCTAGVNYNYC